MAGIGFELQRTIQEDSYLSSVRGYLYAAVLSAGPWLLSVVALGVLGIVSAAFLSDVEVTLFAATVTHTFAVTLITTGIVQMVVTRYLADQLYLGNVKVVAPTFVAVLVLTSGLQFVVTSLLLAGTELPLGYRLPVASLYVAISGIWVSMVFLSAARDYVPIVLSFGVGYAISFAAAAGLGSRYGLAAYLAGFTAGQVVVLALLASRVLAEFELERPFSLEFLGHFRRYPALVAIGFVYNLALWIDKLVFWLGPTGVDVGSFLDVFPVYDTSFFVASLAMVPALAMFTVSIETSFYEHYRRFYEAIQLRRGYGELVAAKSGMTGSLKRSYLSLLKLQAGIALLAVTLLTPAIMRTFDVPQGYWGIFRVLAVGTSMQVFVLFTVLLLLYLDMRGSALISVCTFLVTNLAFTALTVPLGYGFYGWGFLASSFVSATVSITLLADRFRRLEYLTFVRQPM
ncbi:MAG: exopolysaccharide Pel transporter PelG [Actinomycetota bacterium]